MFCDKCGKELTADSIFCPGCGAKVGTTREANDADLISKDKRERKKGKGIHWRDIKSMVGVVVGLGAIIIFIAILLGAFDKIAAKTGVFGAPDSMCGIASGRDSGQVIETATGENTPVAIDKNGNPLIDKNGNYFTTGKTDFTVFLDYSEDEICTLFDFKGSEYHYYPEDSMLFMFDESGKLYTITISESTKEEYPNATIYGIEYDMEKTLVRGKTELSGMEEIGEFENADGSQREQYIDSRNYSVVIDYVSDRVRSVNYIAEDVSDLRDAYEQSDIEDANMDDSVTYSDNRDFENTTSLSATLMGGTYEGEYSGGRSLANIDTPEITGSGYLLTLTWLDENNIDIESAVESWLVDNGDGTFSGIVDGTDIELFVEPTEDGMYVGFTSDDYYDLMYPMAGTFVYLEGEFS